MNAHSFALVGALLLTNAALAVTPPPMPKHRVDYSNFFVLRVNPLGLQDVFDIGYRYRLYESEEPLWRTGQVGTSFTITPSPALLKLGPQFEIEPIGLFRFTARWEWVQWFGILDHMQSYKYADNADYSDAGVKSGGDAGSNYAGSGWQATLIGEFKARIKDVVVRNRTTAVYSDMDLREGDRVWYDAYYDLLAPASGWTLLNEADLLYFLLEDRLIVGARHTLMTPFLDDDALSTGNSEDLKDYPIQRVGPLVAWHVYDDPGAKLSRVTLILLVQWHLAHPFRTGQDTHQGIPYVGLGCNLTGDLWRVP